MFCCWFILFWQSVTNLLDSKEQEVHHGWSLEDLIFRDSQATSNVQEKCYYKATVFGSQRKSAKENETTKSILIEWMAPDRFAL